MKLFGFELKRNKESKDKRTVFSRLLYPWQYGRELATELDFNSLIQAYRNWVYVCANKNATAVASVPLKLYVAKQAKTKIRGYPAKSVTKEKDVFLRSNPTLNDLDCVRKAVEIEEILEHPFLQLMRNVNNFMNSFTLWEMTELYQELCGNAYWYVPTDGAGVPQEIWPMPPQNMKIVPDKEKFISGYKFMKGMKGTVFDEEDVIHFKFPDPNSYYYGKGPLAAVTDAYNIGQNMNKYENALFTNMGRLEGAFETDEEISNTEFERLKEEIKQMFSGVENAGKSPLLDKGVKYKSYGFPPKELSFIEGRKEIKESIANAYGQSLGLYDKEANRANSEMATYSFMKDAIRPRCIRIEEKLNEKMLPRYDENLFVAFDNCVPEDREYLLKERESNLKTGYSSINQELQRQGQEKVDWGDVPLLPMNLVPYGSAPVQPVTEEEIGKFSEKVANIVNMKLKGMG